MFKLTLVTPDKTVLKDAELAEVTLPAHSGELNILPGHAALMTVLNAGRLHYKLTNGESAEFVLAWGYCQVNESGVLVLAESLKTKDELDRAKVATSLKDWDDKLSQESMDDEQYQKLTKAVQELRAQQAFLGH